MICHVHAENGLTVRDKSFDGIIKSVVVKTRKPAPNS